MRFAALLSIVSTVILACGNGSSGDPASSQREEFTNFTPHVWSAEAGVDLFGRGSELLRVASEAGFYWPAIDEIDDYFPGFTDALAPTEKDGFVRTRWGDDRSGYLKPVEETMFLHIADYSETAEKVEATVCHYSLFSVPGRDLVTHPSGSYRIVLENPGKFVSNPGVADSDPGEGTKEQQTPSWNVFGSWKIRYGKTIFGGTEKFPREEDGLFVPQECRDWWLQQFPGLTLPFPDAPYQQQPEGFVPPLLRVGVQYPGWIGPSDVA